MQRTFGAEHVDLGWRYLQIDDLRGADREFAAALKSSATMYPAHAGHGLRRAGPAGLRSGADGLRCGARQPPRLCARRWSARPGPARAATRRRGARRVRGRARGRPVAGRRAAARRGPAVPRPAGRHRGGAAGGQGRPSPARRVRRTSGRSRPRPTARSSIASWACWSDGPGNVRSGAVAAAAGDRARSARRDCARAARRAARGGGRTSPAPRPRTARPSRSNPIARARGATGRGRQERARGAAAGRVQGRICTSAQLTRGDLAALIGVRLERSRARGAEAAGRRHRYARPLGGAWITEVASAGVIEPFENHTFQPERGRPPRRPGGRDQPASDARSRRRSGAARASRRAAGDRRHDQRHTSATPRPRRRWRRA